MKDKAQQAADFIVNHCPHIGTFHGSGEPYGFLQETAQDMRAAKPTSVFPARYIEHVAYAVDLVGWNTFPTPPAAVASVYLATRFEFYFRLLSGKLNADGTWVSQAAYQAALATLGSKHLKNKAGGISSVSLAYEVMRLGPSKVLPYFAALDRALYPAPITGGAGIEHVGDRIEFLRNAAGHGHWGDISADAVFYGLVTAIVFYAH